jgi:DNA invertase Pin-like site-specific DNA recombinase
MSDGILGTRAAIYARFSTDLQRDRSIDDQVALCSEFAAKARLIVTRAYSDRARSGASTFGRAGLLALMDDARAHRFDIVLVEALDRLSRDQEDLAGLYKRLTFAGIEIRAVHDGTADSIQVGIRGLVSTLFLDDLKHKVRRGMAGVIRSGRHAGGRAYGYRPTPGKPGELMIEEAEAVVVRRIFHEFLDGSRPREIASRLNAERVPPPRGLVWNASTINGSENRGNGILLNPLYAGRIIWNRVKMVRDPDTGRRVSRVNPESEWQTSEALHLAIVTPDQFEAARARKLARAHAFRTGEMMSRPKRILSGLLRCGVCGAGMSVHDTHGATTRIRCSRVRESGTCTNTMKYPLDRIERAAVEGVRNLLSHPEVLARYVEVYRQERRDTIAAATRSRARLEKRVADARSGTKRLIDVLARGTLPVEVVEARVAEMENDRRQAEAELAQLDAAEPVVELHPQAITHYASNVTVLANRLNTAAMERDTEVINAFRDLIRAIVVLPRVPGEETVIEVRGRLAALTGAPIQPAGKLVVGSTFRGDPTVAEEGLEPPTRGL